MLIVLLLCSAVPAAQEPDESRPRDVTPPATLSEQERIEQLIERADDGFVPISELPPEEQMPAAPMLVAAYSFALLAIFAYLLSLSRRLGTVKQEIARLEVETKRSGGT